MARRVLGASSKEARSAARACKAQLGGPAAAFAGFRGGISKYPEEKAKRAGVSCFRRELALKVFGEVSNFQEYPAKEQEAKPEPVGPASGR